MRGRMLITVVAALAAVTTAAKFGRAVREGEPAPAVKWGPAPPFLAAGARIAVLQGDPGQTGVFTIRLEFPAGYVIKPHFHPTDESVTVLSGRFLVGMGDSVATTGAMVLGPEGFITAPAQGHHFAIAQRKTVIQVHGEGPFAMTYVNAADDPRGTTATR